MNRFALIFSFFSVLFFHPTFVPQTLFAQEETEEMEEGMEEAVEAEAEPEAVEEAEEPAEPAEEKEKKEEPKVEEKKEVKKEEKPKPEPKPKKLEYQIKLDQKKKRKIKVDKVTKKFYEQASDYNKRLQTIVNEITETKKGVNEKLSSLDPKFDPFSIKTLELLGRLQDIDHEIRDYLAKKEALSPELEKLKIELDSFKEKSDNLRLKVEKIATLKRGLHNFVVMVLSEITDVSKLEIEAGKTQIKILDSKTKEDANALLNKVIEIFGSVSDTKGDVENFQKMFDEKLVDIEKYIDEVTKKRNKLLDQAKKMDEQIENIGKQEAEKAKKEELELAQKVQKRIDEQTKIEAERRALTKLAWYSKIVVYSARILLGIRDSIRRALGIVLEETAELKPADLVTTGTVEQIDKQIKTLEKKKKFAQEIHVKLKEIEKEREKLLGELKGKKLPVKVETKTKTKEEKSAGQLIKEVGSASLGLVKKALTKVGGAINKKLEEAARITPAEQVAPAEEVTPAKVEAEKQEEKPKPETKEVAPEAPAETEEKPAEPEAETETEPADEPEEETPEELKDITP